VQGLWKCLNPGYKFFCLECSRLEILILFFSHFNCFYLDKYLASHLKLGFLIWRFPFWLGVQPLNIYGNLFHCAYRSHISYFHYRWSLYFYWCRHEIRKKSSLVIDDGARYRSQYNSDSNVQVYLAGSKVSIQIPKYHIKLIHRDLNISSTI
jgi:hypothetical protein